MTAERIAYGWGWHAVRLRAAKSYWITTTRADGRPHAAPVWGVWVHSALWFSTAATSTKAQNLSRDPRVSVHLDSSDDVLMLEGTASVIADSDLLRGPARAYAEKYRLTNGDAAALDAVPGAPVFRMTPTVGHTWLEPAFVQTMTRWRFATEGRDPVSEPNQYG